MKHPNADSRPQSARLRWSRLILAILVTGFSVGAAADDLPAGFDSPSGGVSERTVDKTMTITQSQQRAIADWQSFSIGADYTVDIKQPGPTSVLLNRVMGGDNRSIISGTLKANGHVYLINPNGITFGPGAKVDVGGILASTVGLADTDAFLNGQQPLTLSDVGSYVEVEDGAVIEATGGRNGLIALVGMSVNNAGVLKAPGGSIELASGEQLSFDPFGDGLTTLRVDAGFGDASVTNSGQILADGGHVAFLSDGASLNSFYNADPPHGAALIRAHDGYIILDAGDGMVDLSDSRLDASGVDASDGGTIDIRGQTVRLVSVIVDASATGSGAGGTINVLADGAASLQSNGSLSTMLELNGGRLDASGAAAGGSIETSGQTFVIDGDFAVNASASDGEAGTWLLDPLDVTIAAGSGSAQNTIYDTLINNTLNSGTSMTVATPAGGSATGGDVNLDWGVNIQRTAAGGPVDFTINADRSIVASDGNVTIASTGGPLNVTLNADAHNDPNDPASGGGRVDLFDTMIDTNGGDISVHGNWTDGDGDWAVDLRDSQLDSGSGSVAIRGFNSDGGGVWIRGGSDIRASAAGSIEIVGVGQNSQLNPGDGVRVSGSGVQAQNGDVRVYGNIQDQSAAAPQAGVVVDGGSEIVSAGGNIDLVGSAESKDADSTGLEIDGTVQADDGSITLRASNSGNVDALVIGSGASVDAGGMINLRPGEVSSTSGAASDRLGDAITVGSDGSGFSVSNDELSRLSAGDTMVIGSAVHVGAITVDDTLHVSDTLTLQNEGVGSGGISLQAPVTVSAAGGLALLSDGDVMQGAGAAIDAGQVLARSGSGDVLLTDPGNDADIVSGAADHGRFEWVDADDVQLASINATGAQAALNAPQIVQAHTLSARTLRVQTMSGDLMLAQPMSSSAGADLVAAGRFQNPGGGSASGAPWRVWASTWQGETRGGMAGSGALPNLYNCTYNGSCGVSIPGGSNHFIYTAQPTAVVQIDDASRPLGWPNPPLTYTINGLILGDGDTAVAGHVTTSANRLSPEGSYAITGTFASPAGYLVDVVPGSMLVTPFETPDVASIPTLGLPGDSAVYEDNLAGAPICLASEPLDGDRGLVEGDTLAREWSRVRSRPRLNNCVNADRREACGDF